MLKLSLTKAEVEVVRSALDWLAQGQTVHGKTTRSIIAKLDAAEHPVKNAAVGPIEAELMAGARGKVIALDRTGYGRASVQAGQLGVTPGDARLVGEWMARQGWLHGPQTLLDVLGKWPTWVSKARATSPPPMTQPGFGDGKAEQGTAGAGSGNAGGRPAPGFGGRRKDAHPDGTPGDR